MVKVIIPFICFSFLSPLWAQDIDSAKASDKTKSFHNLNAVSPSVRENYTNNKDALKVGCALAGAFIGAGLGYLTEKSIIEITGK